MRLKEVRHASFNTANEKFNFLIPVGALEQHGPFIPFGTDTYITDYLVDELEKHFPDLVILPTLEFSRSQEHRGFFGTVYLAEDTLQRVLFDVCHSLCERADHIFITSFHANDPYIKKFISASSERLAPAKIVHLELCNQEEEDEIAQILGGPLDDHAGNLEISAMMAINPALVKVPTAKDEKVVIDDAFSTDNLAEKSSDGVVDNHPDWVVDVKIGKKILEIFSDRMRKNLQEYL